MFSIAIAGRLPQDDRLIQRLSAQVGQIQALTAAEGKQTGLRIEISPSYASEQWCALVRSWGYPVFGYEGAGGPAWGEMFDRVVRIENTRRDSLGEILCDQADILLAVWNEDIGELDGATWELMRIALKSWVPCIWISTRNGQRYWQDKTVYDTFEERRLAQLVSVAVNPETEPVRCGDREIPMLFVPRFLYNRYIRRYRAARRIVDIRQDTILEPDCPLAQVSPEAEAMRKQLVGQFRRFDQQAIACNERYQSVLYWRAILPLIATLFIALGFYGGSVLAAIPGISKKTWEIIAGCGFLCHALVNLYVFMLSRSRRVRAYQSGMIKNRQMAEMLRMLIHFAPFGMRAAENVDKEKYPWETFNGTDEDNERGVGTIWTSDGSLFYRIDDGGTVDWHNKLICPITLPSDSYFTVEIKAKADKPVSCGFFLNPQGSWDPRVSEGMDFTTEEKTFTFETKDIFITDMPCELLFQFGSEATAALGSVTVEFTSVTIYQMPVL